MFPFSCHFLNSVMKTLGDKAKYICMYDVLPQHDPSIRFTLFDKFMYYATVYMNTLWLTNYSIQAVNRDDPKFSRLLAAEQQIKDITSPEELGILLALCPSQAKDILFAAWCSGYLTSRSFNEGKVFTALYDFCIQDPDAAAEAFQDPDFPDIVRLSVENGYFDKYRGLFWPDRTTTLT